MNGNLPFLIGVGDKVRDKVVQVHLLKQLITLLMTNCRDKNVLHDKKK